MKETKKILCHFSFYDQVRIQDKLEEMAAQGWMIHQPGNFTWTFKKMEPQRLCFAVTYFPAASEFDPGPTEGELRKMDFCAHDGWQLAARWGVMQIFYNENENAVPIETDPVAQVANVKNAMKKNVLLTHILTAGLIVYYMVMQLSMFRRNPVEYLSDPLWLYQIPMWICLLLSCLYEIWFYFHWTNKAAKAAEEDGIFLPIKSNVKASYFLLLFSTLLMIFAFSGSKVHLLFIPIWCGVMCLITLLVNTVKQRLKTKGVSRRVNFAVSMVSVFVLTILFLGTLVAVVINTDISLTKHNKPVGSYEYHGRQHDIFDDPLPLNIEDLMDMEGRWSRERTHQETGLISYTEYDQRALLIEPREVTNLSYTITDIKTPFLCNYIRKAVLNSRQDEVHDTFIFTDHYEPIAPTLWGADEAYQLHWSDTILNTYLVFWENRIVEIKFYWEPTEGQIEKAAELLKQA